MKQYACAIAALLLAPAMHAQPTQLPADAVAFLDMIEDETGVKRLGGTFYGILEEDDDITHVVPLAPDRDTFIQIACSGYCETVFGEAFNGAGESIARTEAGSVEPVLVIPAGNGDRVSLLVSMVPCDDFDCPYLVQAFVR